MHTIAADILRRAATAGQIAAQTEYDAFTPETARALLRRGSDVVPSYASEAAEIEVTAAFGERYSRQDVRDTRLATLATEAWARAFRDAWPAEDVVKLAAQIEPGDRGAYEDETEEELFH